MKTSMSTTAFLMAVASTSAFAPTSTIKSTTSLNLLGNDNPEGQLDEGIDTEEVSTGIAGSRTINQQNMLGWAPDSSAPCYGLPGAIAPLGYFDPLGFCKERSLDGVKRFREAEVM